MAERRGAEILAAVRRGQAVPDAELPRFPKAPRWERDPDFDARVARLKSVRDAHAQRLDLDPGVLCSRERVETIARRNPTAADELAEIKELRRWQVEELGADVIRALKVPGAAPAEAVVEEGSPYKD